MTTRAKRSSLSAPSPEAGADPSALKERCTNGHVWSSTDCRYVGGEWDWPCDCGQLSRDFPPAELEADLASSPSPVSAPAPVDPLVEEKESPGMILRCPKCGRLYKRREPLGTVMPRCESGACTYAPLETVQHIRSRP